MMTGTAKSNRTSFWKPQSVSGLSFMKLEFTNRGFAPHWHEALGVGITVGGGSQIKSRGRIESAEPGTLFVFNPGEPHSGEMGGSTHWRYRSLYLSRQGMQALAKMTGMESMPGFTNNRIADAQLACQFLKLHRVFETTNEPALHQEAMVEAFSCLFERHGGQQIPGTAKNARLVQKVMDWMWEHHEESVNLEDIANEFEVSQFTLIAAFRSIKGITPYASLIQIRLNSACSKLRRGYTPADAAVAVGFYDQSALGRHFKRCYGITPMQYTKAMNRQ